MYADDIVLFAPSVKGLQNIIDKCVTYSNLNKIVFNEQRLYVCMLNQFVKLISGKVFSPK